MMPNTTLAEAPLFWKAVQEFMGAFPKYSQNDVLFSTESYGGHCGPIYAEYIMKQNDADIPKAVKIPLTGLIVINGLHDALIQTPSMVNFTVSENTYDLPPFNTSKATQIHNEM